LALILILQVISSDADRILIQQTIHTKTNQNTLN